MKKTWVSGKVCDANYLPKSTYYGPTHFGNTFFMILNSVETAFNSVLHRCLYRLAKVGTQLAYRKV